jgi:hypothetical protein
MFYRVAGRILRRQALFHLLIPLIAGVLAEIFYTWLFDANAWAHLSAHLLSGPRIALFVGIFIAYFAVMFILIWRETKIGLRQIYLAVLADELKTAKSLFAIGTMNFDEWFDPAVQVYLATIYNRKRDGDLAGHEKFRYERILLLVGRSAKKDFEAAYLDGYHAECLMRIHQSLDINLYFLLWRDIVEILGQLSAKDKADLGYYPAWFAYVPNIVAKLLIFIVGRRRRVRKVAVGVLEMGDNSKSVFRFSKRDKLLSVRIEKSVTASAKFAELIKAKIYKPGTSTVQTQYNFTKAV